MNVAPIQTYLRTGHTLFFDNAKFTLTQDAQVGANSLHGELDGSIYSNESTSTEVEVWSWQDSSDVSLFFQGDHLGDPRYDDKFAVMDETGNWVGRASDSVNAYVLQVGNSIIHTQPTNQTVTETGTAVFKVGARGNGVITYQWQGNGQNIPGATSDTFVIQTAPTYAAGEYRVIVTADGISEASNIVTLEVEPPSSFDVLIADNNKQAPEGTIPIAFDLVPENSQLSPWKFNVFLPINDVNEHYQGKYATVEAVRPDGQFASMWSYQAWFGMNVPVWDFLGTLDYEDGTNYEVKGDGGDMALFLTGRNTADNSFLPLSNGLNGYYVNEKFWIQNRRVEDLALGATYKFSQSVDLPAGTYTWVIVTDKYNDGGNFEIDYDNLTIQGDGTVTTTGVLWQDDSLGRHVMTSTLSLSDDSTGSISLSEGSNLPRKYYRISLLDESGQEMLANSYFQSESSDWVADNGTIQWTTESTDSTTLENSEPISPMIPRNLSNSTHTWPMLDSYRTIEDNWRFVDPAFLETNAETAMFNISRYEELVIPAGLEGNKSDAHLAAIRLGDVDGSLADEVGPYSARASYSWLSSTFQHPRIQRNGNG